MKLAKIKRMCLDEACIIIYEHGKDQWIGTYSACYPVENIRLTEENVIELFDLKPKQVDKLDINTMRIDETDLWMHFINLRSRGTTGKPHPQMVEVATQAERLLLASVPGMEGWL